MKIKVRSCIKIEGQMAGVIRGSWSVVSFFKLMQTTPVVR